MQTSKQYDVNLQPSAFSALPLGRIKPTGWLKDQLRIQADGLTGHLEEHWADVGSDNGWLGGSGDSWERGPYYLDGLLPLAYLLEDEALIKKASQWIEWALDSQRADGSFGPTHLTTVNTEVKDHDWWQDMIMLKVLSQFQEVTGDARVIPFMERYFAYLLKALPNRPLREWAQARGQDLLLTIQWLYDRIQKPDLLSLAEMVRAQTLDWSSLFAAFPFWRKQEQWDHRTHVVNLAMALKAPAVFWRQSGASSDAEAIHAGWQSLRTYHGQAHGLFSGDEWLSGTHPSQGVELCAVVEAMFSFENLVRIMGDGRFADSLEQLAFNALPATISPTWDAHQYDQQVNQIMCSVAKRPWSNGPDANLFGLEPNFGCCTANMHQGWPKFASSLWMTTSAGDLVAISYAPCQVDTPVGNGQSVRMDVKGAYPFDDAVRMDLKVSQPTEFGLWLRVPAWCKTPTVRINGIDSTSEPIDGFIRIHRLWSSGDQVELTLPMSTRLEWRNNEAVSVHRGPLLYVLPIGEQWVKVRERELFHDFEVYPTTAWRYALDPESSFEVEMGRVETQPFQAQSPPLTLLASGALVSNWGMENNSAGSPPLNPKPYANRSEPIRLIPYGCARLRIGEFPTLKPGWNRTP